MKRLSKSWVLVLWVLALMLGLLLPALAQEGGVASKVKNEGASDNASSMLPQKTFIHLLQAAEDDSSNPDKRLASHPLLSPTGLGDPDLKPSFLVILDYAQQVTTSPISFEQTVTGRIPASSERGGYLYETQYVLDVPSGVSSLRVELHGGPGDIDLFMRFGSPVTPHYPPHCWLDETEYDWKSSTDGPDEEIRVSNPRPGRYYIAVCNWASSPQPFQLTAHSGGVSSWTTNTQPISFEQTVTGRIPASSERGGYLYETQYVLDVPSGVSSLRVELHGGPGDIDLFMRFGSPVTPHYPPHCWLDETEYDWKSSTDGPDEEIRVSNPRPGRYYIAVCNWASSPQPFQLTAHSGGVSSWTTNTEPISFEQTVTGRIPASSERGGYLYETQYVLDVPSGVSSLRVELHGGPGDIDLFMRFGSPVTPHYPPHCWLDETEYDWKSSTDGPDEEIRVSNPRPGRYYIAVCNWASSPQPFQLTPHGPPQPVLSVSPTSLTFSAQEGGSNPASQAVTVRNSGGGTLNWSGTSSVGWLRLSPTSGSLTGGNSQSVSVSVNISGMSAGTYTGNITFSAPGAQGSPQTVNVTLTISARPQPPVLSVSPTSLTFSAQEGGSNPASQSVTVRNSGGGTLNWSGTSSVGWLRLSPTSGSLTGGNSQSVSVSVNISGMAAGTYTGNITFSAPGAQGSPQVVLVTLTIRGAVQPGAGQLVVLKFIKLEFVNAADWVRSERGSFIIYTNIGSSPSPLRVTMPDNQVLEFNIPPNKEVIVCGDVVHIDTRP
jgi:hypothetical protein